MTAVKPIMVPDNDGTENEHQVNPVTSIKAIPGLEPWMKEMERRTGGPVDVN